MNMSKLKADKLTKKTTLIKHCYEHRIDFVNFEILNFNSDFKK